MIVSFSNFFLQAVELSETRAMQKYGSKLLPIKFPGCEPYEFRSDEYWACAARQVTTNLHHQVSTHLHMISISTYYISLRDFLQKIHQPMKSTSNNSLAKDILTTYPKYLNSNSFQKKSNGFA